MSAQGQDPWEKYQSQTLDQIVKNHAAKVLDDPDIEMIFPDGRAAILTRDSFPSKVKVTYTGRSRSLSPKRKELIKHWLATANPDQKDAIKLFDTEFLFTETFIEYWLPVQNSLIHFYHKDVKTAHLHLHF